MEGMWLAMAQGGVLSASIMPTFLCYLRLFPTNLGAPCSKSSHVIPLRCCSVLKIWNQIPHRWLLNNQNARLWWFLKNIIHRFWKKRVSKLMLILSQHRRLGTLFFQMNNAKNAMHGEPLSLPFLHCLYWWNQKNSILTIVLCWKTPMLCITLTFPHDDLSPMTPWTNNQTSLAWNTCVLTNQSHFLNHKVQLY
jgi:hypothetical protein